MMTPERLADLQALIDDCGTVAQPIVIELLDEIDRLGKELASYRRAKSENDERFMVERDQARQENQALRTALELAAALFDNGAGFTARDTIKKALAHPRGGGEGT